MNIPTYTILKTERLLLRYPVLDDADKIYSAVKSPLFPERLPLKELGTENRIKDWLKMMQEGWASGTVFSWILDGRDSGEMIGQVTLSRLEGDRLWGLAFWIHPDHWRRGYATEGAGRILAFGFMELEVEKIWAGAGDWNRASCRVLEKIGMIYVGGNPQGYSSSGEPVRTREYEIFRKSWQKNKTYYGEQK